MNDSVADVLKWHERAPTLLDATTSVRVAAELMSERRIGSVLVRSEGHIAGIVTERDLLGRVLAKGLPDTTSLREVMSEKLSCIAPQTTVHAALAVMTREKCRHLPVTDDGRLLGVVSMRDLSAWLTREHEHEIENLVQYIAGPAVHLHR